MYGVAMYDLEMEIRGCSCSRLSPSPLSYQNLEHHKLIPFKTELLLSQNTSASE